MSGYGNKKKDAFLAALPTTSLDSRTDLLTEKCKFNFGYFTVQEAGQNFSEWDENALCRLLDCLKQYSQSSLKYWMGQRVLSIYGGFPKNSDFSHPAHVPHEAQWGRFRLASAVRLVGFVVPGHCDEKRHQGTGRLFDANTFYVVFLDADHRFYKTELR